jgi:hypothetical protein
MSNNEKCRKQRQKEKKRQADAKTELDDFRKCMRCEEGYDRFYPMQVVCDSCLEKNSKLNTAEKDRMNRWDSIEDFLVVHEARKNRKWSWAHNSGCKYINLRIDMRNGGCIISTDEFGRIGPDRLAWQYSKETPDPPVT